MTVDSRIIGTSDSLAQHVPLRGLAQARLNVPGSTDH